MATSKTLKPTGVTIQIPSMGDQPNMAVASNCVDKEADAINVLNDHLVTLDYQIKKYDSSSITVTANASDTTTISVPAITGYTAYLASCYCDNDLFSVSPRWLNTISLNVTLHNFHSASQTTTAHAIIFYKQNVA